jgi:cytidylate kinase
MDAGSENPSAKHVVAIDGPAASGKSSVARSLAKRLGFVFVNTGAMYRAVTWLALREGVDIDNETALLEVLDRFPIRVAVQAGVSVVHIGDSDPSPHLDEDNVAGSVSKVAKAPGVRSTLVNIQRQLNESNDLVMEGRDIGTVVFPLTRFKFYVDAHPEVREARRRAQGKSETISARDHLDSSRAVSPLQVASDAALIDSSRLSVDEVVEQIIVHLVRKGITLNHNNVSI